MTATWVIRFYRRRFLAHSAAPVLPQRGWQAFRWTGDLAEAEKFGSQGAAELFLAGLPSKDFARVVPYFSDYGARA